MCRWYCTSEGLSTNLECLHCHTRYCGACLRGEAGKMESLVKCAKCGKKPRVQSAQRRSSFTTTGHASIQQPISPSSTQPLKSPAKSGNQSIFDRLTDSSLYTGTHQHRFDASGAGRGLEGRDSVAKGAGTRQVDTISQHGYSQVDIASVLRPDVKTSSYSPTTTTARPKTANSARSPTVKASPSSKGNKPSIFDKLTDPSLYTGAHKNRFDSTGRGRGMAGRDAASGIEYGGGKVTNLSQITRTNLR